MSQEWQEYDMLEEKVNELVEIALDKLTPQPLDPQFRESKSSIIDRFLSEYAALYGDDFAQKVALEVGKRLTAQLQKGRWEEIEEVLVRYAKGQFDSGWW